MFTATVLILLQATAPAPAASPSPVKEQKKVCRSTDVIGSRVQKRTVCMTAAQWKGSGRDARDMTQTMQDRLTSGAGR